MHVFHEALGGFSDVGTIVAGLAGLFGIGGVAAGRLPRAGPGRAVGLAVFPLFRRLEVVSKRNDVIQRIRAAVVCTNPVVEEYVVVLGPKGVGKTTALLTAMHRRMGVLCINVQQGASCGDIITKVCRRVARVHSTRGDPESSARRTIFWYRLLTFGRCPTVLLEVNGRDPGEPYADLTGSARNLASMGLKVVIDASPNDVPKSLLSTFREQVIEVGPMPWEMVESEIVDVFCAAQAAGLLSLVRTVISGSPAQAKQLRRLLKQKLASPEQILQDFVKAQFAGAIGKVSSQVRGSPDLEELYNKFQAEEKLARSDHRYVKLPDPDEVLRVVFIGGTWWLVPADPVMSLVLRKGLTKVPALEDLKQLVEDSQPGKASA